MNDNLILKFILHRAEFLSAKEKLKVLSEVKSLNDLKKIDLKTLSAIVNRNLKSKLWNVNNLEKEVELDFKTLNSGEIGYIDIEDDRYPFLLKNIFDPPFMLFFRGNIECIKWKNISIVGTRCATGRAHRATFDISYALGENNIGVVSGLARGIDATAHKGNLSSGGKTVAVLGSSVDCIYPYSNKSLAVEILQNDGAIISEAPLRTEPLPFRFPKRNRIISGLTNLTILSQAPIKSGALITCDFALEQGRDVAVLKAGLDKIYGEGSIKLVDTGAKIIENISDIKSELDIDINYFLNEDNIDYLSKLKNIKKRRIWS